MYSKSIEKLIKLFSKFPTIGPRTAARFVFYLINSPKEEVAELIKSIEELKNKTSHCPLCFKSFEGEGDLCPICSHPARDKKTICVVEKEMDLEALEKTGQFKGLYFILGGTFFGLEKLKKNNKIVRSDDFVIKEKLEEKVSKLLEQIEKKKIKEIILALNPTTEGQNTVLWLRRRLEPLKIKTTQLGRGLPMGGELEYADEETLSSALEGRK